MASRVLEITTKIGCKLRCTSCPQDVHVNGFKALKRSAADSFDPNRSFETVMSLDLFKKTVDDLPKDVEIFFAGSVEPYLNPRCTEMILYAHDKGFRNMRLYTTLMGMRNEDVDAIAHVPFERVTVHLPSKEKNSRIGTEPDYLEKLAYIAKSNLIGLNFMCILEPRPDVLEFVPLEEISKVEYENFSDFAGNLDGEVMEYAKRPPRKKGRIRCGRPSWPVLHPNGDTTLCCMDFGYRHVLGNMKTTSYDGLFESEEFKKIQEGEKDETKDILCRTCEYAIEVPEEEAHMETAEMAPIQSVPELYAKKIYGKLPEPAKNVYRGLRNLVRSKK